MDNKINNISFRANLVTSMHGRNGIMKGVANRFAQKTKGLDGTFEVARTKLDSSKALLMTHKENKIYFLVTDYGDLTGAGHTQNTPENVELIAETFARIFRAMKAQSTFNNVQKRINKNKSRTENALNANQKSLISAKLKGDIANENACISMIEKNRAKINLLEAHLNKIKVRYANFLEQIAGNNTRAKECIDVMTK